MFLVVDTDCDGRMCYSTPSPWNGTPTLWAIRPRPPGRFGVFHPVRAPGVTMHFDLDTPSTVEEYLAACDSYDKIVDGEKAAIDAYVAALKAELDVLARAHRNVPSILAGGRSDASREHVRSILRVKDACEALETYGRLRMSARGRLDNLLARLPVPDEE